LIKFSRYSLVSAELSSDVEWSTTTLATPENTFYNYNNYNNYYNNNYNYHNYYN